jgi:hypothetical protein
MKTVIAQLILALSSMLPLMFTASNIANAAEEAILDPSNSATFEYFVYYSKELQPVADILQALQLDTYNPWDGLTDEIEAAKGEEEWIKLRDRIRAQEEKDYKKRLSDAAKLYEQSQSDREPRDKRLPKKKDDVTRFCISFNGGPAICYDYE